MTSGEEQRLRCEYCLFMEECSSNLRLTRLACSTGLVLFHRFFSLQSFMAHSGFEVAATCLFLASKVEESAKKLEVVITTCFGVWYEKTLKTDSEDSSLRKSVAHPKTSGNWSGPNLELSNNLYI